MALQVKQEKDPHLILVETTKASNL